MSGAYLDKPPVRRQNLPMKPRRRLASRTLHQALPVRTVARLTGLSPDIIRAWEKRHGVVAPVRGPRGARLYSAADVTRLQLLGQAIQKGRSIGDVATLSERELEALVAADSPGRETGQDGFADRIIGALASLDAPSLYRELGQLLTAFGGQAFVHRVAAPLLAEVGSRWKRGHVSIAQEHMLSGMLRNLLGSLLHSNNRSGSPPLLLAAPAGERHEFGLLFVAFLAADAGLPVCFLGTDIPAAEIIEAGRKTGAAIAGLSIVSPRNRTRAVDEVRLIERELPSATELWLGGQDAPAVAAALRSRRTLVLDDLDRVASELRRICELPMRPPLGV